MIKIVQINANFGFGSTGLIVKDIDTLLKENGFESIVVYQKAKEKPINGYKISNVIDSKFHALWSRISGMQCNASKLATLKFITFLKKINPDCVHLHNIHSNFINFKILFNYLNKNNIPTIITLHDCWFFTGKCYHFFAENCYKWKTHCIHCPKNKDEIPSFFFDRSHHFFDLKKKLLQENHLTIVSCSDWINNLAAQSPILQNKRRIIVKNGIDTNIFHYYPEYSRKEIKENLGLNNKTIILVFANKWFNSRNYKLRDELTKKTNYHFLIIGCANITKIHTVNNITFLPLVKDRNEISRYYACADVFLNLTYEDTLPTVNMESICCGTPVLTSNLSGSPELVKNGITGYIFENFNPDKIDELVQKAILLNRQTCSLTGMADFNKNSSYLKYLEIYKNIVKIKS